jgi:hypothetical protein
MKNYKKILTNSLKTVLQIPRDVELLVLEFYQQTLSLDHGLLGKIYPSTSACKLTPTRSEYGYESIKRFGVFKGNYLALKRVVRCNPWSEPGSYDPDPEK